MRSAITAFALFVFALIILLGFFVFNKYSSAFEADQQCHADMALKYSNKPGIDCDHDLETRQWLLFESGVSSSPAKVLERYSY